MGVMGEIAGGNDESGPGPQERDVGPHAESYLIRELRSGYHLIPGRPPLVLTFLAISFGVLAVGLVEGPTPVAASRLLIPIGAAVSLLLIGWWTTRADRSTQKHASSVIVSIVFMAIVTGTVFLILLEHSQAVLYRIDWRFAVTTSLSIGAVIGAPTGVAMDGIVARQTELETNQYQTSRLQQRLQVFNRVLRHNVRNELGVAQGYLEMLNSRIESGDAKEWYQRSTRSIERVLQHTEKMVSLDEHGLFRREQTTVDIGQELRTAVAKSRVDDSDILLTTEIPDSVMVRAHPLIGSAITEAIQNARDHVEERPLTLTVRVQTDEDAVVVTVADNGSGIPESELDVLDRGSEDALSHGHGIGLWMMKWVTDASDGNLSFQTSSAGTTVRFELQRAEC
ncbi:MAG: sensor histidine kinase [Halodesulfurarchaeum sp.]